MLPTFRCPEWLYLPQPVKETPHRKAHSTAHPRLLLLETMVPVPVCQSNTEVYSLTCQLGDADILSAGAKETE